MIHPETIPAPQIQPVTYIFFNHLGQGLLKPQATDLDDPLVPVQRVDVQDELEEGVHHEVDVDDLELLVEVELGDVPVAQHVPAAQRRQDFV